MDLELWLTVIYGSFFFLLFFATSNTDDDLPLDELSELLLTEYDSLNKLPLSERFQAKKNWDKRLERYLERLNRKNEARVTA